MSSGRWSPFQARDAFDGLASAGLIYGEGEADVTLSALAEAHAGDHHHVGPGIRVVTAGELTLVQAGNSRVVKAGDTFYEAGDVSIAVHNKGKVPAVILNFEVLAADWKGSSNIPVKSKK